MTDLQIQFVPGVWAFVLEIVIAEPGGFDFSEARFEPPYRRAAATGGRLVVVGGRYPANERTKMNILKVRMGYPGGGTRFDLMLYEDAQMLLKRNERKNFIRGFRVPGALTIIEHRLWNEETVDHYEGSASGWDVIIPLLPPYAHEPKGLPQLARVEMHFNVSMPVFQHQHLVLWSNVVKQLSFDAPNRPYVTTAYQPVLELCTDTVVKTTQIGAYQATGYASVAPIPCKVVEQVNFTNFKEIKDSNGQPYGLNLTLNTSGIYIRENYMVALVENLTYRLRFWVQPSQHDNIWQVETEDGGALPQNQNDKLTPAIRAVNRMTVEVTSAYSRIPPSSIVDFSIKVFVEEQMTDFTLLEVALPPGLSPWGMDSEMDTNPEGTRRLVTRLEVSQTALREIRETGKTFNLRLQTPPTSSVDDRWFVMAKAVIVNDIGSLERTEVKTEGWGWIKGFDVIPLPATIIYPPVEQFTGWLSITFATPLKVRGTFVQIDAPPTYSLVCPNDPLFLKGACNTDTGYTLPGTFVNVTLVAGKLEGANMVYAFVVGIITPKREQAAVPLWNVRVLNDEHYTVDALIGWRGKDIVKDLFLEQPTLSWVTPPQHGETSVVTIEVTFDRRTPVPDASKGTEAVKALLITLPDRYKHDIRHRNQVKSLNSYFPVAIDSEWRQYDNLRWLRILANDGVEEARDFLPPGTFQFQFPVRVPKELPARMEWYLTMCKDFFCTELEGRNVMANFPMPNTQPVKVGKLYATAITGEAPRQRRIAAAVVVLTALHLLVFTLQDLWPSGHLL